MKPWLTINWFWTTWTLPCSGISLRKRNCSKRWSAHFRIHKSRSWKTSHKPAQSCTTRRLAWKRRTPKWNRSNAKSKTSTHINSITLNSWSNASIPCKFNSSRRMLSSLRINNSFSNSFTRIIPFYKSQLQQQQELLQHRNLRMEGFTRLWLKSIIRMHQLLTQARLLLLFQG